jgi:hypothetical protein
MRSTHVCDIKELSTSIWSSCLFLVFVLWCLNFSENEHVFQSTWQRGEEELHGKGSKLNFLNDFEHNAPFLTSAIIHVVFFSVLVLFQVVCYVCMLYVYVCKWSLSMFDILNYWKKFWSGAVFLPTSLVMFVRNCMGLNLRSWVVIIVAALKHSFWSKICFWCF